MDLYNKEKKITSQELKTLLESIQNFDTYDVNIAQSAIYGSSQSSFYFKTESEKLHVGYIPNVNSSVVNMSEPERVPSDVIIINDTKDKAWFIPSDKVEDIPHLPTLRQAFHEHESFRKRDADYKYHFPDGEKLISIASSNPVDRLDEPVTIVAVEYLGGKFPQSWLLETEDNDYFYLRERSGSIRLYDDLDVDGELIFQAFIGGEHPGTYIEEHEVLNIIFSMDYINIVDNPQNEVPEEAHEEYWSDFLEEFDHYEELDTDIFIDK